MCDHDLIPFTQQAKVINYYINILALFHLMSEIDDNRDSKWKHGR